MYSPVRNHRCHERLFNFANRPTREYFEREGIDEAGGDPIVAAYDWAIEQFRRTETPQVIPNSWGYKRPVGRRNR